MKTLPRSLRALAASTLAALTAGPLSAAILTLNPNADNFIRSDNTGSNTNTNVLLVGEINTGNLRSLLSFDLTSPDLDGATINSVTLTLRANDRDANSVGGSFTVNLNLVDSNFTEGGATWANSGTGAWTAGSPYSTLLSSSVGDPSTVVVGSTFNFASTASFIDAVGSSVSGSGILNLVLKLDNEDTTARNIFRFTSSEPTLTGGVTTAFAPMLTIDYTAAIPEPSAFALLGGLVALGVVAVRRRRHG